MTWPALSSVSSKHRRTWRPCRHMHRWIQLQFSSIFIVVTGKVKNQIFQLVQIMFCFSFRSLTSSSGVTNTWRKGLRRRLKRFVKGVFTGTQYLSRSNFWIHDYFIPTQMLKKKCEYVWLNSAYRIVFICLLFGSCCCFSRASQSLSATSWPC